MQQQSEQQMNWQTDDKQGIEIVTVAVAAALSP
jgi:hypothetical protein